ncbi:XRE family transcriptional regulator [Afipia carboxidovorans]|uniref:XRE family transcriptional regulator n=1 Tax=Afipia carboxidovorans TaxID=40137 RepID=UPI00308B07B1|nr:hypothetical protein CRBSH125_05750 [Afipia carboxidovorans]
MIQKDIFIATREKAKLSQKELANLAGCSQQLVGAIERGATLTTKFLPRLAAALKVDPAILDPEWGTVLPSKAPELPVLPRVSDGYGVRDFPIYSAAEGGPGEIIRSAEAIDWWPRPIEVQNAKGAYGMYIVGTSMIPEFEPGQVAVVNPNLPLIGSKPCIFYTELFGEARATLKRLRRFANDTWYVRQHNPPEGQKHDFTLPKHTWPIAHRVIGRQDPS